MLKNTMKLASLFLLLLLSFVYTDKVFSSARASDPIMKEVISYKKENDITPIEPVIKNDEIYLGYHGLIVNEKESYENMKKEDKFDKNKIIFDSKLPKNTISKTYQYYIKQGNEKTNSVALIFKVNNSDNIDSFLSWVAKNNVKVNFFVDGAWLEDNVETAFSMNDLGAEIYNLGYDGKYDKKTINITNSIIESITLKDAKYCLNEEKDNEEKEVCKKKKMHTIMPSLVDASILDIKKNLDAGIMISYDLKDIDFSNLNLILKTITSRGYKIDYLSKVLSEK